MMQKMVPLDKMSKKTAVGGSQGEARKLERCGSGYAGQRKWKAV